MPEIRNTIPFVIDFFKAKSQLVKDALQNKPKIKLADLRQAILIEQVNGSRNLTNQAILSKIKKISPEDIDRTKSSLESIKLSLPNSGIYRGVVDGISRGLDYNAIAENLCASLDQVFKVMRLIERNLQVQKASPIKELSETDWSKLTAAQSQVLEKALIGFTNNEIQELTGSSLSNLVELKSKTLRKLGKTQDWLKDMQRKLASLKMRGIEKHHGFSDKLFFFTLGAEASRYKEFLGLNKSRLKLMSSIKSLWSKIKNKKDAEAIKKYVAGFSIIDIATRLHYNPDSLSRRLKQYKEEFQQALRVADVKPPVLGVNADKYRKLTEQQQRVITAVLKGLSYEEIRIQEELINTAQVTTIIKSCRKDLGIKSPEQLRHLINKSQVCNKDENPEEFRKRLFNLFFPKGLSYPFPVDKKAKYEEKLEAIILEFLKQHEAGKYHNLMIKRVELGSDVEVAAVLKSSRIEVKNHVKNTRTAIAREIAPFIAGKIPLSSKWTTTSVEKTPEAKEALKERLLSRIFNSKIPVALAVSVKDFRKHLYTSAWIEIEKLDNDEKQLATAYAQGLDPKELAASYDLSISAMSSRITRVFEKIRVGMKGHLDENVRKLLRDKEENYTLIYPDRKLPKGFDLAKVKKAVNILAKHLPEKLRNPYLSAYLQGLATADIAKYYGLDQNKLEQSLTATCKWLRSKLSLALASELPKEISGVQYALLQTQQQVAIEEALLGMTNSEIQSGHPDLFPNTHSLIISLSSGLANFGLDIAWLRKHVKPEIEAQRESNRTASQIQWLMRMMGESKLTPVRGLPANYVNVGFEQALYQKVMNIIQAKTPRPFKYADKYEDYTSGLRQSEIVRERGVTLSKLHGGIHLINEFVRNKVDFKALIRETSAEFKSRLGF